MSVVVRVRDDASGHYAHARGKVISREAMTREEAQKIVRVALNGHEWEIVDVKNTDEGIE